MTVNRDLTPLLAPRSIVLVGASKTNPYASRLLGTLTGGFAGPIHLVNPRQASLDGHPCVPSIAAVPETPGLAVGVVPQRAVVDVLAECGAKGIRAVLVISAGFGEAGDAGRAAEDRIREVARQYDLLVCGPNCLGFVNALAPALVHAYTAFPVRPGD